MVGRKIAVLISSYARVSDLLRQVFSMVYAQTCKEADIYVSVKGVPESVVEALILPQLEGVERVKVRTDGNSNQAWNLLDTLTGVDVERYDLFLKVDDDDFYHPRYLERVRDALALCPPETSTYVRGNYPSLRPVEWSYRMATVFPPGSQFIGWGDMLGMSRRVVRHLLEVRGNTEELKADMKRFCGEEECDLGRQEDRYYFACMKELGPCVDVTPLLTRDEVPPVIVGEHTQGTSIMRGLWASKGYFFREVRYIREGRRDLLREHVVETTDGEVYSLFMGKMTRLGEEEKGVKVYTSFKDGELVLDDGTVYKRGRNGKYVKM